ncbi:MAG: hypothetical protein DDT35_00889 [Firmicutes bacterium]|nr:hypothetical protein [Bacillota bacterium]
MDRILSKKRRSRRRLRVAKRFLLLGVVAILIYGLLGIGNMVYRWASFPAVRYEQSRGVDSALFTGSALVLKDELALVAPRAGVLNTLIEHGQLVRSGQSIFELVDTDLLSSIERQLTALAVKQTRLAVGEDILVARRHELTDALNAVRALSAELAAGIRVRDAAKAERAWRELTRAQQNVERRHEAYAFATRTEVNEEERRTELLAQRQQAIYTVRAPTTGFLSFAPGSSPGTLRASEYSSMTLAELRATRRIAVKKQNGEDVPAGQVVSVIVDPAVAILMIELPANVVLPDYVDIAFGESTHKARVLERMLTGVEETAIVALRLDKPAFVILESRDIKIEVRPHGVVLRSIPYSAIVSGEVVMVYVQKESGKHESRPVNIVERIGQRAVVTGLLPEELVVVNPTALAPSR